MFVLTLPGKLFCFGLVKNHQQSIRLRKVSNMGCVGHHSPPCLEWPPKKASINQAASSHFSEKAMAPHSSTLAWKIPWTEEPSRLQSMGSLRVGHDWATSLSLFTFMNWRKAMATHSSVPAWRIPGTGEPGGLPSIGSHRVRHDWSDLAAAVTSEYLGVVWVIALPACQL